MKPQQEAAVTSAQASHSKETGLPVSHAEPLQGRFTSRQDGNSNPKGDQPEGGIVHPQEGDHIISCDEADGFSVTVTHVTSAEWGRTPKDKERVSFPAPPGLRKGIQRFIFDGLAQHVEEAEKCIVCTPAKRCSEHIRVASAKQAMLKAYRKLREAE